MILSFQKYHGTGNDFIMIDNLNGLFDGNNEPLIRKICQRRFGIGADGLILIEPESDSDFSMRYFNANGKEATMCGNGGRCAVSFAATLGLIQHKGHTRFKAVDGIHEAIIKQNSVRLKMSDVSHIKLTKHGYYLDTGSPHLVKFVKNPDHLDVFREGRKLRYESEFAPEGVNVNFVEIADQKLLIRTYERGVEDETLACGTGSVAAAIAASIETGRHADPFQLAARGGELQVSFSCEQEGIYRNVWLEGPTQFVYEGKFTY